MATIVGNPDQTFNDLGLPDSQKFEINSILLFVGDSSSIELKTPGTFEELVVNEDIFSPAATGYILITDTLGLIENINIKSSANKMWKEHFIKEEIITFDTFFWLNVLAKEKGAEAPFFVSSMKPTKITSSF